MYLKGRCIEPVVKLSTDSSGWNFVCLDSQCTNPHKTSCSRIRLKTNITCKKNRVSIKLSQTLGSWGQDGPFREEKPAGTILVFLPGWGDIVRAPGAPGHVIPILMATRILGFNPFQSLVSVGHIRWSQNWPDEPPMSWWCIPPVDGKFGDGLLLLY